MTESHDRALRPRLSFVHRVSSPKRKTLLPVEDGRHSHLPDRLNPSKQACFFRKSASAGYFKVAWKQTTFAQRSSVLHTFAQSIPAGHF
ncbi:unnamed protein product [Protopolystoma xenopodis]|uniref:Uncharacterized protein n=1 Tax=Protopolystoma xenopodis TaxID=117903 RepID=A0A3S5BQH3_9PLAT|nr:unnamed protein product [Protopolystoma xenopodis]